MWIDNVIKKGFRNYFYLAEKFARIRQRYLIKATSLC